MAVPWRLPGDLCAVCGNYCQNNPWLSFYRFFTDVAKHSLWVRVFELDPEAVKPHQRVCSLHFLNDHPKSGLLPHIGRQFASPISDRRARAIGRQQVHRIQDLQSSSSLENNGFSNPLSRSAWTSTSSLPQLSTVHDAKLTTTEVESMTDQLGNS